MAYPKSFGQHALLNACFVSDPTGNGAQSGRWKRMQMVQGCGGRSPAGWCSAHVATEVSSALRSHACVCLGQLYRLWTQDPNGERILRYRRSVTYPKLDSFFNTFVELSCSLPVSTFSDGVHCLHRSHLPWATLTGGNPFLHPTYLSLTSEHTHHAGALSHMVLFP